MSRNYSATAADTTLSSGVTSSATTIAVSSATGFPAPPYLLVLDPGQATQEVVEVTAAASLNLTVTRGFDSTPAVAHDAGATVRHSHSAIDFRESRAHEGDTTGVHGVTGSVVGTAGAQTLTNKTLTDPVITQGGSAVRAAVVYSTTDPGALDPGSLWYDGSKLWVRRGEAWNEVAVQGVTVGNLVGEATTQPLSNKTIGTSNTINGFTADRFMQSNGSGVLSASARAVPGSAVVGISDTQTLTNKTLAFGSNTVTFTRAQLDAALTDADVDVAFCIKHTAVFDVGSIAAGTSKTVSVAITGVVDGDFVVAGPRSFAGMPAGLIATAVVAGTNAVDLRLYNASAATIDPPNTTWYFRVWKA